MAGATSVTVLGIRTDKPEAELYLYDDKKELGQLKWSAHRELAETIHKKLDELLSSQGQTLRSVRGIVCFKGPGSFTGLRIGLTVANALAYAQNIPIVARRGDDWLKKGIADLQTGKNDKIATPYYDRPAATSAQKS
ncbi:MAG: tRNA (adenosine(37)-N6)-threonylcarbamoyltransferase complex dimerization subunit type 1 TsaB [bacterium]|nr:tRNA (adenosine(37)-N6)-threonylcarbamoyltransferase complex dimerization subunit type 1 TsaB [bacterium]